MLSLANVSVEMASSYFENDDYYSRESDQGKPEFYGKSADLLDLKKNLNSETFSYLLSGRSPDGRTKLIASKNRKIENKDLESKIKKFEKLCKNVGLDDKIQDKIKNEILSRIPKTKDHFSHMDQEQALMAKALTKRVIQSLSLEMHEKNKIKKATNRLISSVSKDCHRAGFDCTFSAPKSVSLASLVGGNGKLIDAHKTAVDYALNFLEKEYIGTRVSAFSRRTFEKTGNMVAAKFLHGTSREGDPQVHTHCVIMNMTHLKNGSWRSIHNDEIYKNSKLIGLIYQNKLAELVRKLGYEIEVNPRGTFEIKGYTQDQLKVFSKRRSQVVENTAKLLYEKMPHEYRKTHSFEEKKEDLIKEATQKLNRISVKENRRIKSDLDRDILTKRWEKESQIAHIKHPAPGSGKTIFGTKIDTDFTIDHLSEKNALLRTRQMNLSHYLLNPERRNSE